MREEDILAKKLSTWLNAQHPKVIYHFDTGSGSVKSIGMAMRDKRLNKWRGWSDLFIAEPKEKLGSTFSDFIFYHGLFLELKKEGTKIYKKDGFLVADKHIHEQLAMIQLLKQKGYAANFAIGFDDAVKQITEYLS